MAKQPRALKTQEEISAVSPDEPILVELPGAEPEQAQPSAPKPPRQAKPPKGEDEDAVKRLTREVDALKAANERQNKTMAELERDRRDAYVAASQLHTAAEQARAREMQSENDYLSNALTAAQSQLEAAKASAKRAGEAGDFAGQAEAHDQIADARSRIRDAERDIASLDRRVREEQAYAERQRQQPPPQQQQQPQDVNQAIESNNQLLPAEKDFLKQHPELVLDTGLNQELSVAHNRALRSGIRRGSDAYFKFVNEFMGFANGEATEEEDAVAEPGKPSIVSAPVSRETSASSSSPTRVHLTPEQREMARSIGVTDMEYAAEVLRLQKDKQLNPEKYATR
jgi:hypothetical protein